MDRAQNPALSKKARKAPKPRTLEVQTGEGQFGELWLAMDGWGKILSVHLSRQAAQEHVDKFYDGGGVRQFKALGKDVCL